MPSGEKHNQKSDSINCVKRNGGKLLAAQFIVISFHHTTLPHFDKHKKTRLSEYVRCKNSLYTKRVL